MKLLEITSLSSVHFDHTATQNQILLNWISLTSIVMMYPPGCNNIIWQ